MTSAGQGCEPPARRAAPEIGAREPAVECRLEGESVTQVYARRPVSGAAAGAVVAPQLGLGKETNRVGRRGGRYRRLRTLRERSRLKRVRGCRRVRLRADGEVTVRKREGVAHFSGVQACGSVWACPVCGPKIREARRKEVEGCLLAALATGRGVLFLTVTVRHHRGDRLYDLRWSSEKAWKRLQQTRAWKDFRSATGAKLITAREVTWTHANGWHPHRHCAVVTDRALTPVEVSAWDRRLAAAWQGVLKTVGLYADRAHGWRLEGCESERAVGAYLVKVAGEDLGLEMTRGDLKRPAGGSLTPEMILEAAAEDGDLVMWALWNEYEVATEGWRFLTWSQGLRSELLDEEEEATDEELAAEEVGGDVAVVLTECWPVVAASEGCGVGLLEAVEAGTARWWLLEHVGPNGWTLGPGQT